MREDVAELIREISHLAAALEKTRDYTDRLNPEKAARISLEEDRKSRQTERQRLSDEIAQRMDRICDEYLTAQPEERREIRDAASRTDFGRCAEAYVHRAASNLGRDRHVTDLLRGLASVSIENKQRDYRDTILATRELLDAAKSASIDPLESIERIASLSDCDPSTGGGVSMRDFLLSYTEPTSL